MAEKHIRKMGSEGNTLVKSFEKLRTHMYSNDGAGHCTVGWGHLVHKGQCDGRENEKQFLNGISRKTANQILNHDMQKAEKTVSTLVEHEKLSLNQNQYDALVSFAYNTGSGNLKRMIKGAKDKQGKVEIQKIPERMKLYDKSGGKIIKGLTNRRTAEVRLFNKDESHQDNNMSVIKQNLP